MTLLEDLRGEEYFEMVWDGEGERPTPAPTFVDRTNFGRLYVFEDGTYKIMDWDTKEFTNILDIDEYIKARPGFCINFSSHRNYDVNN